MHDTHFMSTPFLSCYDDTNGRRRWATNNTKIVLLLPSNFSTSSLFVWLGLYNNYIERMITQTERNISERINVITLFFSCLLMLSIILTQTQWIRLQFWNRNDYNSCLHWFTTISFLWSSGRQMNCNIMTTLSLINCSRGAPTPASMASGMVNMIPKNVQQQVAQEVGKSMAKGMVNSFFNK